MVARIGIFAGTFDPVHKGHIAFAKAAMQKVGLAKVVFLPEPQPRFKQHVTNIVHRQAMLRAECKKEPNFDVLVLDDSEFSVPVTLPKIQHRLNGELFFLFGADVAASIRTWPGFETLAATSSIIIGNRQGQEIPDITGAISVTTDYANANSTDIRQGDVASLSPEVVAYIRKHKLYNI